MSGVSTLFGRVLVPLDGSPIAEAVIEPVAAVLRAQRGDLVLAHAVTPAEWFTTTATQFVAAERRRAAAYLDRLARRIGATVLRVEVRNHPGEASGFIVETARKERVGLIAMSTHGRGGVRDWAFGSVTERVLRTTDLPVLIFHGLEERSLSIRRILVAIDGSDRSMAVIPAVCDAAGATGAEVAILHVGDRPASASRPAAETLARHGIRWRMRAKKGDPAACILKTAESESADLVAMTTFCWAEDRSFCRDIVEQVLRKARCPLLMIPEPHEAVVTQSRQEAQKTRT